MVCALGTPRRHRESGIYWFRKRVPDRLKAKVGKSEIKFSLRTRDPDIARLRNLEAMVEIERAWAGYDVVAVSAATRSVVPIQCKSVPPAASDGGDRQAVEVLRPGCFDLPAGAGANAAGATLRSIFKSYTDEAELAPATVKRWAPVIDRFVGHLGHDEPLRISRSDIVAWKDVLLKEGRSNITVRDVYLAAIKATLQFAVDQGALPENPASRVKVRVKKALHDREKGFDHDEAKDLRDAEIYAILRATFGPFDDNPGENVRNARRWVPWLLAYTGARVSEMTRLESRHIFREEGVDAIHIERSKTGGMRKVPIHQDLKDQGFLDFVSRRRGQPLFFDKPKLTDDRKLTIHRTRAEGLAEWIRTLDAMKDSVVAPNHGFRHRWRTECRRIFMDREVRNYLQGHKIETVGEGYGHMPLDVSAPWIEMFPRFDVSGEELVVHRRFDLSLLTQAAMRMAETRGFGVAEKTLRLSAA
jgi:integrase